MPSPILGEAPERLSASAWQTLVSCPYRYFARYGLGLGEEEEVAEEMEKRDYGELVHAILARFHGAHPVLSELDRGALLADLRRVGRSEFAQWLAAFPLAEAWLLRWEKRLEGYLDWALGREAEGYRWAAAEQRFEQALPFGEGRTVMLHGRLDRIDMGPEGMVVLDYKTQARQALQKKLKKPGEDVQLPFYGLLTGAAEAAFVSLDDDKVAAVGMAGDLAEAAEAEAERIARTLLALDAAAALPALGAPETCQWCEMRGLCRRDHWPERS
jgi:ATP-dependent helicase/nuclease subunit B